MLQPHFLYVIQNQQLQKKKRLALFDSISQKDLHTVLKFTPAYMGSRLEIPKLGFVAIRKYKFPLWLENSQQEGT
jgi:hypothetical protein